MYKYYTLNEFSQNMKTSFLILTSVALLFSSCSSFIAERNQYLIPYHEGNLSLASCKMTSTLNKALPHGDYRESIDATWLLLDSATMHFSQGDINQAIQDYNKAIEAIDYYSQTVISEQLGKVLLQDELGGYAGEDFEQILARIYFALALIHQGDYGNAHALLRQVEDVQQKKIDSYQNSPITKNYTLIENALGKYLLAILSEKKQDFSNARILYQQALEMIDSEQIENDLSQLQNPSQTKDTATVLVLCHNGNIPEKISTISPPSIASTAALEIFLGRRNDCFKLTALSGIPTPTLITSSYPSSIPTYCGFNDDQKPLEILYPVAHIAYHELEQQKPIIVARGIARYLLRRETLNCISEQNRNFGTFADLAMLVANLNTKADTRSWTTLPESIDFSRYQLSPGNHQLKIHLRPSSGFSRDYRYDLKLKDGDLCIIHIFNIHPHVTNILVPNRFLALDNKENL